MAGSKKQKGTADRAQAPPEADWVDESEPLNSEHQKMLEWLKTVKFKRSLVNGVDEVDVWRKLEELNNLYEASLIAERAGYEALLDEYETSAKEELKKYKLAVKTIKQHYDELVARYVDLERQLEMVTAQGRSRSANQVDHSNGNHKG